MEVAFIPDISSGLGDGILVPWKTEKHFGFVHYDAMDYREYVPGEYMSMEAFFYALNDTLDDSEALTHIEHKDLWKDFDFSVLEHLNHMKEKITVDANGVYVCNAAAFEMIYTQIITVHTLQKGFLPEALVGLRRVLSEFLKVSIKEVQKSNSRFNGAFTMLYKAEKTFKNLVTNSQPTKEVQFIRSKKDCEKLIQTFPYLKPVHTKNVARSERMKMAFEMARNGQSGDAICKAAKVNDIHSFMEAYDCSDMFNKFRALAMDRAEVLRRNQISTEEAISKSQNMPVIDQEQMVYADYVYVPLTTVIKYAVNENYKKIYEYYSKKQDMDDVKRELVNKSTEVKSLEISDLLVKFYTKKCDLNLESTGPFKEIIKGVFTTVEDCFRHYEANTEWPHIRREERIAGIASVFTDAVDFATNPSDFDKFPKVTTVRMNPNFLNFNVVLPRMESDTYNSLTDIAEEDYVAMYEEIYTNFQTQMLYMGLFFSPIKFLDVTPGTYEIFTSYTINVLSKRTEFAKSAYIMVRDFFAMTLLVGGNKVDKAAMWDILKIPKNKRYTFYRLKKADVIEIVADGDEPTTKKDDSQTNVDPEEVIEDVEEDEEEAQTPQPTPPAAADKPVTEGDAGPVPQPNVAADPDETCMEEVDTAADETEGGLDSPILKGLPNAAAREPFDPPRDPTVLVPETMESQGQMEEGGETPMNWESHGLDRYKMYSKTIKFERFRMPVDQLLDTDTRGKTFQEITEADRDNIEKILSSFFSMHLNDQFKEKWTVCQKSMDAVIKLIMSKVDFKLLRMDPSIYKNPIETMKSKAYYILGKNIISASLEDLEACGEFKEVWEKNKRNSVSATTFILMCSMLDFIVTDTKIDRVEKWTPKAMNAFLDDEIKARHACIEAMKENEDIEDGEITSAGDC